MKVYFPSLSASGSAAVVHAYSVAVNGPRSVAIPLPVTSIRISAHGDGLAGTLDVNVNTALKGSCLTAFGGAFVAKANGATTAAVMRAQANARPSNYV